MEEKMLAHKQIILVLAIVSLAALALFGCAAPAAPAAPTTAAAAPTTASTVPTTASAAPTTASTEPTQSSQAGKILRVGMAAAPQTLNPFVTDAAATHEAVVYSMCKLGQFAPDSTIVPYLADWDLSDDGTTYTFHINPDAKWHDGQPVTAKDVEYTYTLASNKDSGVVYFDRISAIKGAEEYHDGTADHVEGLKVVDDKTIEITLKAPNATWLALSQSAMFILPEHILGAIETKDTMNAPYWQKPVGCGPYEMVEYAPNQYIRFQAFKDYFLGAPKIDELALVMGPVETMGARFKSGEVDVVRLQAEEVESFKAQDTANLYTSDSYVYVVDLNHKRPFLQDATFRKALMYALDREAMNQAIFFGTGKVAPNMFVTPWTLSPDLTTYTYDPAKAKELLQQANYDGSQDFGIMSSAGGLEEKLALIIQQNLADVGVKTHVEFVESNQIEKEMAGEYDMAIQGYGTMSLLPDAAAGYLGTDSEPPNGSNWSFYQDQTLTDLFEQAAVETDQEARVQLFHQITERTSDQAPMLYLLISPDTIAVSKRVNIPEVVIIPRNRPGDFTWLTSNINTWDINP